MKYVELLATALTIAGLYYLSVHNNSGFVIGAISNLAWLYYAHEKRLNGIAIVNAILLFINLNGIGIL